MPVIWVELPAAFEDHAVGFFVRDGEPDEDVFFEVFTNGDCRVYARANNAVFVNKPAGKRDIGEIQKGDVIRGEGIWAIINTEKRELTVALSCATFGREKDQHFAGAYVNLRDGAVLHDALGVEAILAIEGQWLPPLVWVTIQGTGSRPEADFSHHFLRRWLVEDTRIFKAGHGKDPEFGADKPWIFDRIEQRRNQ